MSVTLIIGAWLLAAPAHAQRVSAPVTGITGLGRVAVMAPAPTLAPPILPPAILAAPALNASPALTPALIAAPVLSAPAAVSVAPAARPAAAVPLKLSAGAAALAEFSKLDLNSSPAADLKGGADALMSRALGAQEAEERAAATLWAPSAGALPLAAFAPEGAREPASGPGVHLLSKPLHATVELGRTARFVYYALEAVSTLVKAALTWHATGSPAAAVAMVAFDAIKAPGWLASESLADLNLRYWWKKLSTLKRLADTPGVTRIRVLTTGQAEFSGMLARRKDNTGLVFVDSDRALPAELEGFGAPISVSGLDGRRVRLTLIHHGAAAPVAWTPTLGELLSGAPIPEKAAQAWRESLDSGPKGKIGRLLDFKKDKTLRVEAKLEDGRGGAEPLGTVVFGGSVKKLVGLGRWDRALSLLGRRPPARAIPISDTIVERGGERRVEGFWRRLWMRLTGALIVRP